MRNRKDFKRARTMRFPFFFLFLAMLVFLNSLTTVGVSGQAVTGTILGTVKDPSGAPIPGASVRIINTATGEVRTVTSGDEGLYQAPSLPPGGPYSVEVEMAGFKKSTTLNIALSVDQKARIDVVLAIGAVDQTVEVIAEVPLVQSDTSELGTTVQQSQIRELPLNGRDFVQLTRLIPGVQRGIPGQNTDGSGNLAFRASASFAANGMRAQENSFILDGIDDNELLLGSVVIFPSVDALQEFKVQTSSYSAEFGHSLGGVVNLQMKSGANKFHGNVFEFLRNDALDANDWFNDANGRAKPPFRQNQFGGTLGGPIWKDHTFFFGDYQGLRISQANSFLSTVPTDAMKTGDFSTISNKLYDPTTKAQFAGNIIPSSRFDAAASNILNQLYPAANVPGTTSSNGQTVNNYLYNPPTIRNDNQFDIKVDHQLNEKNLAFARYSYESTQNDQPASLPHGDATVTSGAANAHILAQSATFNDTYTLTQRLLNEFRIGFSRFGIDGAPIDYGSNLATKVGIPGINYNALTSAFTQIVFSPGDIRSIGTNSNQPFTGVYNAYQALDNVIYSLGKHSLKFGVGLTIRQRNQFNVSNPTGKFTFQPQLTSNCAGYASGCTLNSSTGFSVASFLLGYASAETRDYRSGLTGERKHDLALFVQDDYKVRQNLTLNLGLRYDYLAPNVEEHDRMANFDTATAKMVAASDNAVVNNLKVGRGLRKKEHADFGPRVGFAWQALANSRLVVRAGYGLFYNSPMIGGSSQMTRNLPFGISQSTNTTFLPTLVLSAGLPAIPALNLSTPLTGSVGSAIDPNLRNEAGQNWNLDLQSQIGKDYLVEAAYVGSYASPLFFSVNINQAPPVVGVTNQNINRPYYSVLPSVTSITQIQSGAFSWYHALQLKGTKRFSHNFMFLASYTYSKSTDISSSQDGVSVLDSTNVKMDYGPSAFDVRNNLTGSFNYSLPFGKNKRWGGWELSGITSLHTGVPFTVSQSQGVLSTGTGNRPNRIKSGVLSNRSQKLWFDTSAFVQVPDTTGTYGNSGRNILTSPATRTQDLSVLKNTNFEKVQTQFRCEFFNIANTPQFGPPSATLGTGNFGTITSLLYASPMRQIQFALKVGF